MLRCLSFNQIQRLENLEGLFQLSELDISHQTKADSVPDTKVAPSPPATPDPNPLAASSSGFTFAEESLDSL